MGMRLNFNPVGGNERTTDILQNLEYSRCPHRGEEKGQIGVEGGCRLQFHQSRPVRLLLP